MTVIEFPKPAPERTVADYLRDLIARFEAGNMPEAFVYIASGIDGPDVGLIGETDEAHAYWLFGLGKHAMINMAMEPGE